MQPLSSIPLGPLSCRCTAVVEMWKERVRAFEAIVHTLHLMLTHARKQEPPFRSYISKMAACP